MTIDELLKIARDEIAEAQAWVLEGDNAGHAAIAQAAALTALAMILDRLTLSSVDGGTSINIFDITND